MLNQPPAAAIVCTYNSQLNNHHIMLDKTRQETETLSTRLAATITSTRKAFFFGILLLRESLLRSPHCIRTKGISLYFFKFFFNPTVFIILY